MAPQPTHRREDAPGAAHLAPQDATTLIPDDKTTPIADDETTLMPDDETTLLAADGTPIAKTAYMPQPTPSFDEEHGSGIGVSYDDDYSRLGSAYQEPQTKRREARIPRMGDMDGAGHNVPGEGKSRSKWRPLLAFLLVALMVAGVVAAGAFGLELWGGRQVPNLVGFTETRAVAMLDEKGLTANVSYEVSDDRIGVVLRQDPAAGTRLEEGATVAVIVAQSRTMPEVVGLTLEEAQQVLADAGAQTVEVVGQNSAEPEGQVIGVTPAAGEAFSSQQKVVLVVAQRPEVPNVVGMDKLAATTAVEQAGFAANVTYVNSDQTPGTVVETVPAAGEKHDLGASVELRVSEAMPSAVLHLGDYFGKSSSGIASYLSEQGFWLSSAHQNDAGFAEAAYTSDDLGTLYFTSRPYSHAFDSWDWAEDVLANGVQFQGIRWEVPSNRFPSGAGTLSEEAVRSLMATCGFSNIKDVCTEADIALPEGATVNNAKFRCVYGESGNGAWTILLAKEAAGLRVVVTCAPKTTYTDQNDLEPFGGSICDLVAYTDMYTEWPDEYYADFAAPKGGNHSAEQNKEQNNGQEQAEEIRGI